MSAFGGEADVANSLRQSPSLATNISVKSRHVVSSQRTSEAVKRKCAELTEPVVPDGPHGELPTTLASLVRGSGTHSMKAGKTMSERFPPVVVSVSRPSSARPRRSGTHSLNFRKTIRERFPAALFQRAWLPCQKSSVLQWPAQSSYHLKAEDALKLRNHDRSR